jgi:RNA polymerase sigma-70 factor (ECF subfamily)
MQKSNEARNPMDATFPQQFWPKQLSDDQLLSQARSGDKQAFGELCLRYQRMLKRTIFRIIRHREDTEDVLQDTLLRAYQHLNTFQGKCKFSTWITSIGINASLVLLRKRRRLSNSISELAAEDREDIEKREGRDPKPTPEQCQIISQTRWIVDNALRRLPSPHRKIADLHYRNDTRVKDAAVTLGITEAAAKSRILRARHMLRRSLKREGLWNS